MNPMPHWLLNFLGWWFVLALYVGTGFSITVQYCEQECWDNEFILVFWAFWPVLVIVRLLKRLGLEAFFTWLLSETPDAQ